jgi:RHS repeat-associated protein
LSHSVSPVQASSLFGFFIKTRIRYFYFFSISTTFDTTSFTGYERDNETDLDFAQARMYSSKLGRFSTTDPIYFQIGMMADPQRFNLYGYARNNPLLWTDPDGGKVRIAQGSSMDEIYESVGGQAIFDKYFEVKYGLVDCKTGVDCSNGNQGVQLLNELVGRDDTFLVYLGADANAVAKLFDGAFDANGKLTEKGAKIVEEFNRSGTVVSTRGRPRAPNQPAGDIFTVLAINPANQNMVQIGLGDQIGEAQYEGWGLKVRAVSILIHELAENLDFSRNGAGPDVSKPDEKLNKDKATRGLYQQQLKEYNERGSASYKRAHNYAIGREAKIRKDLSLFGGFAGGQLQKQ